LDRTSGFPKDPPGVGQSLSMPCEYGISIIIIRQTLNRTELDVVWTPMHPYVAVVGWLIPVNTLLSLSLHPLGNNIFNGLKGLIMLEIGLQYVVS
jgi:hypothetical protein